MNERQPYGDVRKFALQTRKTIARRKRLLNETDQLLRGSRHLISRSQELIREGQRLKRLSRILSCNDHEDQDKTLRVSGSGPKDLQ
jgi:hypothetical protein